MFKVEFVGLSEFCDIVGDAKAFKAAAYRAINRTVDGVVTDVSSTVRSVYNVQKSVVDGRIKKKYCPDYATLTGEVSVKGGEDDNKTALPLINFGAVARKNFAKGSVKQRLRKGELVTKSLKRAGVGGVAYRVMKQGKGGFSGKAFIIKGGNGSYQVVRRIAGQKGKYALKEKRVISIAGMVGSMRHDVMAIIKQQAEQRFNKNMEQQYRYYKDRVERGLKIGNGK